MKASRLRSISFIKVKHHVGEVNIYPLLTRYRILLTCSLFFSIYTSAPFKFIVGNSSYFIHADLVSRHSAPLDRMINGRMLEAQNGFAKLESVDGGTMERFIEWAYHGYYTPAAFHRDPTVSQPPASTTDNDKELRLNGLADALGCAADRAGTSNPSDTMSGREDPVMGDAPIEDNLVKWVVYEPPFKNNKKPKTKKDLKKVFDLLQFESHSSKIVTPDTLIRLNKEPYEDYTEVLLSHARLHVFADMYDIRPLKTLTLKQLHYTLANFTLHRQRTGDIVALLRYVYANTLPDTDEDGTHLRTMLKKYVAYEMSALMRDEKFNELMVEDGGPLLADFFKMVAYRIH